MIEHRVTLPDGRVLAVAEYGRPDGPVVVFLPCAPGSRRLDPDPGATAAAGVRLLVVDRAGYGASSPVAAGVASTLADRGDDVAAALPSLGVAEAAVIGWSNGGSVALALAARHPAIVRALVLTGTPAPDDDVAWVPEEYRRVNQALRADPPSAAAALAPFFNSVVADPAAAIDTMAAGPADEAVLADPARHAQVVGMLTEAFLQGEAGVVSDIVAVNIAPPGFDPAAVGAPTTLFYGTADVLVGPEHGRYWAERVPEAELRLVDGAGHVLPLTHWADLLAAAASSNR
jgi:pimeloyl-ACP methyl ester carboxylesterase